MTTAPVDAQRRSPSTAGTTRPTVFVVGARGVPNVEGGAEKNAEMIFPLIAASGYRVILAGLTQNLTSDNFRGVELRGAPSSRILKTDKLLYYVWAIFQAMRIRPAIVHLQGLGSALFLWAYKFLGCTTVVRYGSADYLVGKWGLLGRLGFLASEYQLRFADGVIAVTPALAQRLSERGITRNVHVVSNALDEALPPEQVTARQKEVLTVGRVTSQKNIANLIVGFRRFNEGKTQPWRLSIVGGLDDVEYVRSLDGLTDDSISFTGRLPRSDIGARYWQAGIFVNASLHEGHSNAILEAISHDCPIIVSDIPENRDLPLKPAQFFDPAEVSSIAEALERAAESPGDYKADKSAFQTWPIIAQATLAIYEQILRPKGSK